MFKLKYSSFFSDIERFLTQLQDAVRPNYYLAEQLELLSIYQNHKWKPTAPQQKLRDRGELKPAVRFEDEFDGFGSKKCTKMT